MILSKENLKNIAVPGLIVPEDSLFDLPEKVLQFGSGVLLRGLPDYYIDKANHMGIFNGRVVVVKSTDTGTANDFEQQDDLYTLSIKGIENGQRVEENVICSSISRVLSAGNDWPAILAFARDPNLVFVTSNTTEVGIQLIEDDIDATPPLSFPGKLLAVLHERYKAFMGSPESGLVIAPAELITDNGTKLRNIVMELAEQNDLDWKFKEWLEKHNYFCNTLVDRIVPGKPDAKTLDQLESAGGYRDDLRIVSESYSLWAIEGGEKVRSVLTFAEADKGVVITPDIETFRELKIRLLNGTHTLGCAVAYLSGFNTVKTAMDDVAFSAFVSNLMLQDIAPAIPYNIPDDTKRTFAASVIDRFRNPHIEHLWLSIASQYSSKITLRVLPIIQQHYRISSDVPEYMVLGFAAFLRFMKVKRDNNGNYVGSNNGRDYKITDSNAAIFEEAWKLDSLDKVVNVLLKNENLWDGPNLTILPGFEEAVLAKLKAMTEHGVYEVMSRKSGSA